MAENNGKFGGLASTEAMRRALGNRILVARRARQMTQVQLAKKIEADQGLVSKWEKGKQFPSHVHMTALAKALDTSVEALNGVGEHVAPVVRMVRLVGEVAVGEWLETLELPEIVEVPVIGLPRKYDKEDIKAFRVRGDSMNRVYPDSSLVYVAPSRAPKSGQIVLVMRHQHGQTEATLKEYVKDSNGEWLWPRSDSPAHQAPLEYKRDGDEVQITGLVVAGLVVHG